jgi:hypothetical protein
MPLVVAYGDLGSAQLHVCIVIVDVYMYADSCIPPQAVFFLHVL